MWHKAQAAILHYHSDLVKYGGKWRSGTFRPVGVTSVEIERFFNMNPSGDIDKVYVYEKLRCWAFMLAMAGNILTRNA